MTTASVLATEYVEKKALLMLNLNRLFLSAQPKKCLPIDTLLFDNNTKVENVTHTLGNIILHTCS